MAYVVIHGPNGKRTRFPLTRHATVGRTADSEIWVDDPRLSRKHCRIEPRGSDQWVVVDLGSTNGTLVDGKRIAMPHVLRDEQTIYVGESRLVFYETAFITQRPVDPLERLMFVNNLQRESAGENTTVFGVRTAAIRPQPVANEELIKPRKRIQPDIPLPFKRPRPMPRPIGVG